MREIWLTVKDYQGHNFDGSYEVSSWGRLRKSNSKKILSLSKQRKYKKYDLVDVNNEIVRAKIHRLVAFYFLPTPPNANELEVNHKDGNPHNNSFTNLAWVTHSENMQAEKDFYFYEKSLIAKNSGQKDLFEGV